jgi:hypothetical protein
MESGSYVPRSGMLVRDGSMLPDSKISNTLLDKISLNHDLSSTVHRPNT